MITRLRSILKTSLLLLSLVLVILLTACSICQHTWGEWTQEVAPTCESAGTRLRVCTRCGEKQEEPITALAHEFGVYTSNNDANCKKNATETASCTRCQATSTREIENSKNPAVHASSEIRYQASASSSDKHDKISICCNAILESAYHRWDDGKADPNAQNVTVFTCEDCGATKKTGGAEHVHSATRIAAVAAGCEEFGNIEYWYCADCDTCFADQMLTTQITRESTLISPAHTGGTATCTSQSVCSRCQTPYGLPDPENHTSTEYTFAPHETDATKHEKKHSCCGAVIETSEHRNDDGRVDGTVTVYVCYDCHKETLVPIEGHTHSATYVPEKAANCTEYGNGEYWYCASCQKYFSNEALTDEVSADSVIIAPTHTSTEYTYSVNSSDSSKHDKKYACCGTVAETVTHKFELKFSYASTCSENGYNLYYCVCGATNKEYTSPASGHNVEEWSLSSESAKDNAQCVFTQLWSGYCFICHAEIERETEVVRHSYKATITLSPTCKTTGEKIYSCDCGATPSPATEQIAIDPNAHAWDEGTTSSGVTTYTCQNAGCGAEKTVILSSSSVETLDAELLESNEVIFGDVSLRLDNSLIENLDSNELVTLSASAILGAERDVLIASLPAALRAQIDESTPIMDFALTQNGEDVDFNGGSVFITMKYTLPADADADCVTVWYVNNQNELSFYEASYYEIGEGEQKQGYIWFYAEHFSSYLPGIAPSIDACEVYDHLWETTVTAPTCTSRGFTEYHCQRCGESKIDDLLYPIGHAFEITEITESTCQTAGSRTQVCTRDGCDYEQTVALSLAAHKFEYDSEKSTEVTCTQDGVVIYSCATPGCNETKEYDRYEAWGHGNYREVSAALLETATKCTEGVIITYQCGNDNYVTNSRCTHTIEKIVYTHVNEFEFEDNKDGCDSRQPQKIMLGSYLTAAGINYTEEPYVEIKAGCICGEQASAICLYGGTSQYGEQLFSSYGEPLYSSNSAPYPGNQLWNSEYTATGFSYDPATGPMESSWTICFIPELIQDGCTYTYSVDIALGYNSQTETASSTVKVELLTYDVHTNKTRTVTLDDPNKSCYYNCNLGTDFVYGIHITDTCDDCGDVVYQTDTSVNTSSSHYYCTEEVYEAENGFKVHIRTCPCGATRCDDGRWNEYNNNYDGVRSVINGSYSFSSRTENIEGGTVKIYTGVYNADTFIYAVESLREHDKEKCRDSYYNILYLNCDVENYKICEKTVICKSGYMTLHTYETETVDTPIEGNSCYIKRVTTSTCIGNCGKNTVSETVVEIHTPTETTVTDSKGNKTYTAFCETCGYNEVKVTDASGQMLRRYIESIVVQDGKLCYCVSVELYTDIDGEIKPILERCEIYEDSTKQNCLSWNESLYQYRTVVETEKGCFKVTTTTVSSSLGNYSVFEEMIPCCEFGETEYKEPTCQQEGYERRTCINCGYAEYLFGPQYGEHDIWSTEPEYQERTCLQDGYNRYHCANCDYYEEPYYEQCYGHEWMSFDVQNSNGMITSYHQCSRCGSYTGSNPMQMSSVDAMVYDNNGDAVTVKYINRNNSDSAEIEAEYEILLFLRGEDEWGNPVLKVNEDGTPVTETLSVAVLDDGNGNLTILCSEIEDAVSDRQDFMCVCLAVKPLEEGVTYIMLK